MSYESIIIHKIYPFNFHEMIEGIKAEDGQEKASIMIFKLVKKTMKIDKLYNTIWCQN